MCRGMNGQRKKKKPTHRYDVINVSYTQYGYPKLNNVGLEKLVCHEILSLELGTKNKA